MLNILRNSGNKVFTYFVFDGIIIKSQVLHDMVFNTSKSGVSKMTGPVRVTVHHDQGLRPSGRGRTNREERAAYDDELRRLVPHVAEVVRRRLRDVETRAEAATKTKQEDVTVDQRPYASPARQSATLFVEIQLNSVGPFQAASNDLRLLIAGDILCWLGYHPRVATYLEINLVFVPMSGMRVLFNGRDLRDSWGEDTEPDIGYQIPST